MADATCLKRVALLGCIFAMLLVFFALPSLPWGRATAVSADFEDVAATDSAAVPADDDATAEPPSLPPAEPTPASGGGQEEPGDGEEGHPRAAGVLLGTATDRPPEVDGRHSPVGSGDVLRRVQPPPRDLVPRLNVTCEQKVLRRRKLSRYVSVSAEELRDIEAAIAIDVPAARDAPFRDGALVVMSLWKKCRHITGEANCGDMTYQSVTWVVFDWDGRVLMAVDPPYPTAASAKKNPVFRRGKGLKFINSTHVVGLLGSAVQPPYPDYRLFIWNLDRPSEVHLYKIHSHHDVEYNPHTKHFLTLTTQPTSLGYTMEWIDEVDTNGRIVHRWNSSALMTYVRQHDAALGKQWGRCHSFECRDRVHGNTLAWDWEAGAVYLNSRHLDAFYKLEWPGGRVLWGVGRTGHFKLFDLHGRVVSSLVYHAHQLNLLGGNRFLLFDNGRMNTFSSAVIIRVDEVKEEAHLEFRYAYPRLNYQPAMGGVLRTPTGSILASLGYGCFLSEFNTVQPGNATIVEVTPTKQKVWEMHFAPGAKHGWMYYRVERFYLNPLIWLLATHLRCHPPAPCAVAAQVWNTYYTIHPTSGTAFVLTATGLVLARQDVVFERYWQPTNVTLALPCMDAGDFPLQFAVENSEGYGDSQEFQVHVLRSACRHPCLEPFATTHLNSSQTAPGTTHSAPRTASAVT